MKRNPEIDFSFLTDTEESFTTHLSVPDGTGTDRRVRDVSPTHSLV